MGRLIYTLNVSADGFVETTDKGLDWSKVDDELHRWFNEREASLDALLYGRGMYETMTYWKTAGSDPALTETEREYARIWNQTPLFVFSSSLASVDDTSRLVRGGIDEEYPPLRREFSGDIGVGGATLAASFIRMGLVDEYQLLVHPVAIGAGTPFFPPLATALDLRLVDMHRFTSGVVYLAYRPS